MTLVTVSQKMIYHFLQGKFENLRHLENRMRQFKKKYVFLLQSNTALWAIFLNNSEGSSDYVAPK